MEAQMHSFWRLISLRHLFAEVFVGCLKARALCSPRQPSAERLLQHCPPIRGAGGELPVPWDIHRAPSLPFCHSRSCAGGRNDSHSDHCMHSPGLLIASLPKGQLGALPLLLLFSPFPGEHSFLFLQLTWTKRCHELVLNGLQMEAAAGGQHLRSAGSQNLWLIVIHDKQLQWLDTWLHCWP